MFVDSHCHLDCIDLGEFENDYDVLVNRCLDAGVEHMLCVSIDMDKYPQMASHAGPYRQISLSVGVHPMADEEHGMNADQLRTLAVDEKVVAIGETGLDYYYHKGDRSWQQQRFRMHLQAAVELNKPVIIHTRDAGEDTLAILREENAEKCGGVIHCFTESLEFAQSAMEMGFMISFSGIITFNNADRLRTVAKMVPDENLLIETDSPYLAPVPYRGKQNYPALVRHVAGKLADVRGTTLEHIASVSRKNFYRVFRP